MNQTPRIKVTTKSFSNNSILNAELISLFPNTEFNYTGYRFSEDELIDFLRDADGIVLGLDPMTKKVIEALPRLKIIAKYGVGLDNVDVEYAKSNGKTIGWTGGVNKRSVAEQTLGFMLGLCRNLFNSGYKLKACQWEKKGGWHLTGKTVGIIGCGHTGSEILKLLQPFECELLICDILNKSETATEYRAKQVDFDTLISKSDVVSLHVPHTGMTHHMINADSLSKMKESVFLINIGRGLVVEQEALKKSLMNHEIAGAALDVFEVEPPTDKEFLALPNLMVTPHIGGDAREASLAMGRSAIRHLKSFFFNEPNPAPASD
jgi:phosphoglycerate dehydrogenase-like enzyme